MQARSEFVKCRVTAEEKAYVERVAKEQGTDTAGLIRRLLFEAAPEQIHEPPSFFEELDRITPKPASMASGTSETFGVGWPE